MKFALLPLFFLLHLGSLCSQYDFPVVINGIAVSLEYRADDGAVQSTVYPEYWLLAGINDCFGDSLLISRSVFPRTDTPPPQAADSLVIGCQDAPSISLEIWWKGEAGDWLVTDSYVLIAGNDQCACTSDCAAPAVPTLLNGVATTYPAAGNLNFNVRQLLARTAVATTYSFSDDPADSVRNYACDFGPIAFAEVFAHRNGLLSRSAQTYLAIGTDNCPDPVYPGAVATVIQGLSVPTGPAGIASVPARAFAVPFGPPQQLAFSEDPADTLFTITCDQIGTGGVTVSLFNHSGGQIGPPASSYLIGDDGRRFCATGSPPYPANDSLVNAEAIDHCVGFHQFWRASVEAMEPVLDSSENPGATVWHSFSKSQPSATGTDTLSVRIQAVDSLFYGLYPSVEGDDPLISLSSGLLLPGTDTVLAICGEGIETDHWLLQLQQASPQAITRYYLNTEVADSCLISSRSTISSKFPDITIFPSPSRGQLRLRGLEAIEEPFFLHLFNGQGSGLGELPPVAYHELSSLAPGIYYLRISTTKGQRTLRWLKL